MTDGKTVYANHSNAGLFAVNFSGALQWSREVEPAAPYPSVPDASCFPPAWGSGASPILHNDRLYIVSNNEDAAWFFGAFSPRTGEELWRVGGAKGRGAFGSDSGPQNRWATPFVCANEVRTEIVVMAGGSVRSRPSGSRLMRAPRVVAQCDADAVRSRRSPVHRVQLSRRRVSSRVRYLPGGNR